MAAGLLWFARLPAGIGAVAGDRQPTRDAHPAARLLIDVLPGLLLFGLGIRWSWRR